MLSIIGSGAAALTCAITLSQRFDPKSGIQIHIFEKHKKLGGNSVLATSGLSIMNPARGDTVESYLRDIREKGALARVVCRESVNVLKLCDMIGVKLPHVVKTSMHSIARTYTNKTLTKNIGQYLIRAMIRYLKKCRNVFIHTECRVIRLCRIATGAKGRRSAAQWVLNTDKGVFISNSIVCATGGYGYNRTLLSRCNPVCARMPTSNREVITGDGIALLKDIDALFVNKKTIQLHPTGFVTQSIINKSGVPERCWLCPEIFRAMGAKLINLRGARFIDELSARSVLSNAILKQPHKIAIILFTNAAAKLRIMDTYVQNKQVIKYSPKIPYAREIRTALQQYLPDEGLRGYIAYVTPCIHYTLGGIRINTKFQVLDEYDKPIPNIYACGELAAIFKKERACGLGLVSAIGGGLVAARDLRRPPTTP